MSEKSGQGNGHDAATVQIVAVLERIEVELKAFKNETRVGLAELRGDLIKFKDETRGELTELRGELRSGLAEVHHEIADTNVRLAELRTEVEGIRADLKTGLAAQRDLGTRVQRLEDAVFKRTGT